MLQVQHQHHITLSQHHSPTAGLTSRLSLPLSTLCFLSLFLPSCSIMSRSAVTDARRCVLFVVVLCLLLLSPSLAHVEFAINTDTAGDDGFLAWLKIPHGCILAGPDDGDAPLSDTEASTNAISITVPASIPVSVAGVLTGWTINRTLTYDPTQANNITTFTYTALPGNELVYWQALAIPFVFTLPSPSVDTAYYMPTVQYCVGGYITYWNTTWNPLGPDPQPAHPSPTIIVLGTSDQVPTTGNSTTTVFDSSSSSTDHRTSIAAIVLASVALAALLLLACSLATRQMTTSSSTANDKTLQLTNPNMPVSRV